MNTALPIAPLAAVALFSSCETLRSQSTSLRLSIEEGKYQISSDIGHCAKLTFYGEDGSLGCGVFQLPAQDICPPEGTRGAFGEIVECPGGPGGPLQFAPSSPWDLSAQGKDFAVEGLLADGDRIESLELYRFFGLPYRVEPGEIYLEYDLEIRATSRAQARAIRDEILAQARLGPLGFQEPVPGVYHIRHLARAQLIGREVLLSLFSSRRFEDLTLHLNDIRAYRDLSDAHVAERHGWFVTSFTLALSDLHWGLVPGVEYVNRFQVEAARAEGSFEGAWGYRLGA